MTGKRTTDRTMAGFLDELAWRGLLQDRTPGLAERLKRGAITAYVGFDPTAPSLQVGNLVPVMLLAHLQRTGGRPIVVMGGGTGLIGDPSGKQQERPLLEAAILENNLQQQADQFRRLLPEVRIVNNAEWLGKLSLVEFLRDVGKHFTVSLMLQKESIKARLEEGISVTEFSYMLLQAYDFWHLFRDPAIRCEMQMGGSDQWGNITAGIELIRRREGKEAHGLSGPLLTTSSGAKFGKTEGGLACWLSAPEAGREGTTPYRFYQFWVNVADQDVESWLKMFTFLDREIIATLMKQHRDNPSARIPHRALAFDIAARVHGEAAATRVREASEILFGQVAPSAATAEAWRLLATELSASEKHAVSRTDLPLPALDLVFRTGLDVSKSELRRLFQQGGVYINGQRVDAQTPVGPDRVLAGRYIWLRRGKKTDHVILVGP